MSRNAGKPTPLGKIFDWLMKRDEEVRDNPDFFGTDTLVIKRQNGRIAFAELQTGKAENFREGG